MKINYTLPLDQLPDPLPIVPLTKPFDVTITPPGSKSITCRAYVLAALADGESKIIRPLRADDTDHLLKALCTLGVEARWDGDDVYIKGVAGRFPRGGNLYMGDGGTPTRFMIACACLAKEPVVIDASPRMRERPIAEGVDMLRQLGAKIEYVEEEGRLPVRVAPAEVRGGELGIGRTSSSQFISAAVLISACGTAITRFRFIDNLTSASYVRLTCEIMREWKCKLNETGDPFVVQSITVTPHCPRAMSFEIAPDASSAIYWYVATSISPKSSVQMPAFACAMSAMYQPDAHAIRYVNPLFMAKGTTRLTNEGRRLLPMDYDASGTPDASLALAILAACSTEPWPEKERRRLLQVCKEEVPAGMRSRITGLRTLRVKETDRIAALANELRKIGCAVETGDDWIAITPPTPGSPALRAGRNQGEASTCSTPGSESRGTNPVIIEPYNDHRMAMAFAVLGLVRPGISIRNPACVKKSYPTFWKDFAKLYQ